MSNAQRKAMFAKLKKGELKGKTYKTKKKNVVINYRNMTVSSPSGRNVGKFKPAKIMRR